MLLIFLCAGTVLLSSPATAIRWDFDDGTTQGWGAKKPGSAGGNHLFFSLSGAVEAGVWRISAFRTDGDSGSGVTLISPTIGHDSYLFDRVRVRFRTVHPSPTIGALLLRWTNEHNLMFPGGDPLPKRGRFSLPANGTYGELLYTTEWQEFEFSLADLEENLFGYYPLWEGLLDDIRLSFVVEFMTESPPDRPASTKVSALEVDWIELTGVEEVLQGELPRPPVFDLGVEGPKVFAPPVFYPIVRDLGPFRLLGDAQEEVLTDLDGDGDLDLFSFWGGIEGGWVMARNNGQGAFETIRIETLEELMYDRRVHVGDVTGDGQDEIVLGFERWERWDLGVWAVPAEFQIEPLMQKSNRRLVDVVDWDGDGQAEVFAQSVDEDEPFWEVWDWEKGAWTFSEWPVPAPASGLSWAHQIGDFTGDGTLEVLWGPADLSWPELFEQPISFRAAVLGADPTQGALFEKVMPFSLLAGQAGDFDGDGQVDLLAGFREDFQEQRKGLAVWSSRPDGLKQEVIYDENLFLLSPVVVRDLNADGLDDWVFIGGDYALGFGVFIVWGGGLHPSQAVEWHLLSGAGVERLEAGDVPSGLEGNGVAVLPGDVDGDGDVDLVVLDRALEGVHVLKNPLSGQMTAVQTAAATRPAQHRLGDSYPNPFNPTVVLPLDLATDAGSVSLTVYDVLGRRVRQVWQGPLGAGSHRLVWDGRDEAGKDVAAGVYLYQVEIDGQVEAKKTTKLP